MWSSLTFGSFSIIPDLPRIHKLSISDHSLMLDVEGDLWAMGNNDVGQLGLGDEISRTIPEKITNLPTVGRRRTPLKSARNM